jgi:hypothetical protein
MSVLLTHLSNYPANIPYSSLAVFATILTVISYIKNKKYVKTLVEHLNISG